LETVLDTEVILQLNLVFAIANYLQMTHLRLAAVHNSPLDIPHNGKNLSACHPSWISVSQALRAQRPVYGTGPPYRNVVWIAKISGTSAFRKSRDPSA
jgi:hypothetical protein